jgi:iron(III) transport system substrate-binding protein
MPRTLSTLLVVLALALAACGDSSPAASGDDASSVGGASDTSTDASQLVVYSGRSEELIGPLLDRFTEETGIEVSVRYGGSTELATTLLQEGEATDADVFFAQDPASLGAAAPLMAELDESILSRVPDRFSDADGRWVGTSGRARVVVYDTNDVDAAELPNSLDELVDPRWSGRMAVAPTNGSFLAFVAAMIVEQGEDYTLDWLERLAENQPVDYPGNSPIVAAVDAREVDLGLVNHYYLLRLQAEGGGAETANHFPSSGDASSLVMPAGVSILAGSDQAGAAQAFVEFLLSESSQEYFATETFEFPLVPGIAIPDGLPDIDEIATPDIDLSDLADQLERATDLVTEAGLL